MRKQLTNTLALCLAVVVLVLFSGCDALIGDVEDPIDTAEAPALDQADQVPFLVTGIEARFANTHDNVTILTSILSDQFIFAGERGGGATFPTYRDLDTAEPTLDNNSVDTGQNYLGEYRFLADDLIRRIERIDDLSPEEGGFADEDAAMRQNALMEAYFHGGLARYFWATYWGLDGATGGGVISDIEEPADETRGEFAPSAQMYDLALERLEEARSYAEAAGDEHRVRVINTVVARIHLFHGNLSEAHAFAEVGMQPGDAPYQSLHSDRTGAHANEWFNASGPGRVQTAVAPRFVEGADYLGGEAEASPEWVRTPLDFDAVTTYALTGEEIEAWAQGLYMTRDAPIDFATWQENHLMRAELALRGVGDADAAALVNEVRAYHGLEALGAVDLDVVFLERDKELFTQGQRLVDQRRVTLEGIPVDHEVHGWHRTVPAEGDMTNWWYLPITLDERDDNPNIPSS